MLMIFDDISTIKAFIDYINTVNVEYLINKYNKDMAKTTYMFMKILIKQNCKTAYFRLVLLSQKSM